MYRSLVRTALCAALVSVAGCGTDEGSSGDEDAGTLPDTSQSDTDLDADVGDTSESDVNTDADDDVVDDTTEDVGGDADDAETNDTDADPPLDADSDPIEDATEDPIDDVAQDADVQDDVISDVPTDAVGDSGDTSTDASDDTTDVAMDTQPDTDVLGPFPAECGVLVNGNAETGDISGWTIETGEFEAVQQQAFTYPDPVDGSYSFAAGETELSILRQDTDATDWAEWIDEGGIYAHLSGQLRNWNGNDGASLVITALSESGAELATVQVGPFLTDEWTQRSVSLELPVGTRTIRSALRGDRNRPTDNDAYFDVVDLCVSDEAPIVDSGDLLSPPYLMWATTTAISVMFETEESNLGTVEYGTSPDLGESMTESAAGMTHELRLEGLTPDTLYYYAVSWGGGAPLPIRTFRTAQLPGDTDDFTFVVWGDNQNGPDNFRDLTPIMSAEQPVFAVSTGDCVQNGTRGEYRSQLFDPMSGFADEVPFVVAAGNHERYGGDDEAALFDEYMSQGGDEHCFGYQWGDFYLVLIDTELSIDPGTPQHTCITDALSTPEAMAATFRAAAFHKPPRIEWWFGGNFAFPREMEAPWVREILEPLLESLDVDIVFNGHNHLYAHTPETPGGITWVTTGGAGGSLDTDFGLWRVGTWPQIETTIHEFHFLSVNVSGNTMTINAIGTDGASMHETTVVAD